MRRSQRHCDSASSWWVIQAAFDARATSPTELVDRCPESPRLGVRVHGPVNRLGAATSPYLQQHKDNPVDWGEWSPEAFAEARERNVPVLLSVGYAACHWCHVMYMSLQTYGGLGFALRDVPFRINSAWSGPGSPARFLSRIRVLTVSAAV